MLPRIFIFLLGILITFFACYKVFKGFDYSSFLSCISSIPWYFLLGMFILSFLAYYIRVIRWKLLLENQQSHFNSTELYTIQSTAYLISFIIPRFGDVYRIAMCKRLRPTSLHAMISVLVFERISDVFVLIGFLAVGWGIDWIFNYQIIHPIITHYHLSELWLYSVVLILFLCVIIYRKWKNLQVFIREEWSRVWPYKQSYTFIVLSISIWFIYVLLTYLWFEIIPLPEIISFSQGWIVMLAGSIARSLPLQAGSAGVYHLSVSYVLTRFKLSTESALNLALLIHGFQTVFTLVSGLISYIWLLIYRPNVFQKEV